MLTGEYLVLAGARALALPLLKGQTMEVEFTPGTSLKIYWTASDLSGLWFEAELALDPQLTCISTTDPAIARRLVFLLNAARSLNPEFLNTAGSFSITNQLGFDRNWGWGSSSTLISNVAWWASVDPYELNRLVSDGSGYDIACARSGSPLIYTLKNGSHTADIISFHPQFQEHLAFIYLGKKQDTTVEINLFQPESDVLKNAIDEISEITMQLTGTHKLSLFNCLINKHELIISNILNRVPVKEQLFPDFEGSVKSLGAWGGDFVLASSTGSYQSTIQYFREKGYQTAFSWKEIIR